MEPKVIKTDREHEAALALVEKLMDAEPGSKAEADLELWSVLIEKYEEEHFPVDKPDPVSAIRFRMEQQGLSQSDLAELIRSKSKVSEVLSRRRPLSIAMIRAFQRGLGIPAEVLIQPMRLHRTRPRQHLRRAGRAAR